MSVRSRIRSVVLAGTLACSLGVGSLAMATEAPSADATNGGAADLGSAISQIATNPGATDAQTATPSYLTASTGPLTYQVAESWQPTSIGDASQGLLYDIYTAPNGLLQVVVANETGIGQEDAVVDTFLAGVTQSSSMSGFAVDSTKDRTLDGTLIRDIEFEGVVSGSEVDGKASFVFGSDYTGILTSIYMDDGSDDTFQQAHDSLGLTISNAMSAANAGFTAGGSGTTTGNAVSAKADAGVASDTSAKQGADAQNSVTPDATPTQVADGTPIDFEGFSYLVSTDPSTFVRATVESYEGDPDNGTPVIGVPVTITNNSGETKMPDAYLIELYGPKGLEQDGMAPYYFDDSVINVSNLRPGATVNAMLYFVDEGAGEYVAVFNNYVDQPQEISVNVQ